jgi:hypothetical protein
MLVRQVDRQLRLTRRLGAKMPDRREPGKVRHELKTLLGQRIFGSRAAMRISTIPETLRYDAVLQSALERNGTLASPPTLCDRTFGRH